MRQFWQKCVKMLKGQQMTAGMQKSTITIQAKLTFESDTERKWTSCMRCTHLRDIGKAIQSLESEPERVSGPLDGTSFYTRNLWQVLKVAAMTSLSPDRVLKVLSVLKPVLVSGQVGKPEKGASSCFLGQGLWLSQIPPAGGWGSLKWRDINTPARLCSFAQFE